MIQIIANYIMLYERIARKQDIDDRKFPQNFECSCGNMAENVLEMELENSESSLAMEIMAGRKCQNTENQYRLKVEHFRKWIELKHPLCLDEKGAIDLDAVDRAILKEFLGHICEKKDKNGVYYDPVAFLAFQHVSGYKSALKDYYSTKEVKISGETEKMLKQFFEGYVRRIAKLKQDGVMPIVEGKQQMSFEGYKFLASKAIAQKKDCNLAIFSHLYLLLCWNLIARCVSVGSLMYNHISWENDSLVIVFPSHKGDKEGRTALPKHVYAKIAEPSICPILSFAVYVFTRGYERECSKMTIFAGEAESRFSKWLSSVCTTNKNILKNQGAKISMIGTHSFRKGIASFLSGTPGGATAISIYLRAGWSLGPVQLRYILEGEGGNQVCGRVASGLPLTDVSFANLPPHFLHNEEECLSSEEWEEILPGYSTFYPSKFREVIPYLLASLIYHQRYLTGLQVSNPRHSLFLLRVWTNGVLLRLKDMVGAGCNRNPVSKMSATGIPPHLVIANRIVDLQKDMDSMKDQIINKLAQLPEALKQAMLENFQIDGTVPITRREMHEMMKTSIDDLKNTIETSLRRLSPRDNRASAPVIAEVIYEPDRERGGIAGYTAWSWNGHFHPVNFAFPV